jgi:putative xylitol transport system ATP-binding protein
MTVAENVFLGREPPGRFGRIDFRKMNAAAQAILDDLGFAIPAGRYMHSLSVAQMQLVEIAKALSHDAEVIFMDEPTSAIGEREAHQLFAVVRRLREQGRGVVYVSHRLSEVFDIADRYTVFRDGAYVGSGALADVDRASLIHMIVGREISEEYAKVNTPTDEEGLSVVGLTSPGKITDISFTVRKGEIFGIYGLMGSGRSEIFDCLFGLDRPSKGEIRLSGKPVSVTTPAEAIAEGVALVTEDRKLTGLNLNDSIRGNNSLGARRAERLRVSISDDEVDPGQARDDHIVDPVAAGASHAAHHNAGLQFLQLGAFRLIGISCLSRWALEPHPQG